MDRQSVYSTHVYEPTFGDNSDTRLQLQTQLETFILDFRLDNNFVYRYTTCSIGRRGISKLMKIIETN